MINQPGPADFNVVADYLSKMLTDSSLSPESKRISMQIARYARALGGRQVSNRTRVLLKASKAAHSPQSWDEVAVVLKDLYYADMPIHDVLGTVVASLQELVSETRFEVFSEKTWITDMLLAPCKFWSGPRMLTQMDRVLTLEQFYDSIIRWCMSQHRTARVDWCFDQLHPGGSS